MLCLCHMTSWNANCSQFVLAPRRCTVQLVLIEMLFTSVMSDCQSWHALCLAGHLWLVCVDSKIFGFCTKLPCCLASLFMFGCYLSGTCALMIEPQAAWLVFKLTLGDPKRFATTVCLHLPAQYRPTTSATCTTGYFWQWAHTLDCPWQPATGSGYCDHNITNWDKNEKLITTSSRGLQHSPIWLKSRLHVQIYKIYKILQDL